MQTLHELARSLNDPSALESGLEKLRDGLLEIPRMLQICEQTQDISLGRVSGDHNFRFTFRLEGGGFFQTGVLIAAAESFTSGMPIPLRCKWKRRVGDLPVEIPGVTSNMYQISADDVGTEIWVEAQPADADDGHRGTVFGSIGPFEVDPTTRRSLDNALAHGSGHFGASLTTPAGNRQEVGILVTDDGVRVSLGGRDRPGKEVWTEYSTEYPRVIVHPLDTTKFQLTMNETRIFNLTAPSRTARDLVALTVRCMHARRFLPPESVLSRLLPAQPTMVVPGGPPAAPHAAPPAGPPAVPDRRLRTCIVLDRLAKELNRAMQQRELAEKMLRNTGREKKDLQEQLMETISGFTDVIEGLQAQCAEGVCTTSSLGAPDAEGAREQMRELASQNRKAQADLQSMQQRLEKLQRERAEGSAAARQPGVQELAGAGAPAAPASAREQSEQARAQELKRLRQDVEGLHHQKEHLLRQLQDRDRERQELQDSFLYVKGQLDTLQLRQAQGGAGCAEKELNRSRCSVETATLERNQAASRLEDTLREQEKEKAYHEQSLERFSQANARLMEERDRAAREVRRIAQLYSQTVGQFPSDLDTTAAHPGLSSGVPGLAAGTVDPEELRGLRQRLERASEAVRLKEQENESLKHRIRKLASA